MKTKNVFIVMALDESGEFVQHPSFQGREFTSIQAVMQEVIDTEQRVSYALSQKQVPDSNDTDYLAGLNGSEIMVLNTITFGDKAPKVKRKLVEPRDPGKQEIERLQEQLQQEIAKMADFKKQNQEIEQLRKDLQTELDQVRALRAELEAAKNPTTNKK